MQIEIRPAVRGGWIVTLVSWQAVGVEADDYGDDGLEEEHEERRDEHGFYWPTEAIGFVKQVMGVDSEDKDDNQLSIFEALSG